MAKSQKPQPFQNWHILAFTSGPGGITQPLPGFPLIIGVGKLEFGVQAHLNHTFSSYAKYQTSMF